MLQRVSTSNAGFDKLQTFLLRMAPGDVLSVVDAVKLSGLDQETCGFVLNALATAGLMIEGPGQSYRRCRLHTVSH